MRPLRSGSVTLPKTWVLSSRSTPWPCMAIARRKTAEISKNSLFLMLSTPLLPGINEKDLKLEVFLTF
jgi:hypothetical protein